MPKHTADTKSRYAPIDFLGDLDGPGGNVFSVFGAIKRLGKDVYGVDDLLKLFKQELDDRKEVGRIKGSYEDVLDLIEEWFGEQSAINTYREEHQYIEPDDAAFLDE